MNRTLIGLMAISLGFLSKATFAEDIGGIKKLGGVPKTPFVQIEFVILDKIEDAGKIVASYRDGTSLSNTDKIYLEMKDKNLSIGDRLTVLKNLGEVKKQKDFFAKSHGTRTKLIGSLRVTKILPDLVEGILYDCTEDAKIGDPVVALFTSQIEIRPQQPSAKVEGQVLGPAGTNRISGSFEMVFINRGADDGLKVNDLLEVIRKGEGADKKMRERLPDVSIAELVVVHTSSKTATAYVRASVESFEGGARFRSAREAEVYLDDKKASNLAGQKPELPQTPAAGDSLRN